MAGESEMCGVEQRELKKETRGGKPYVNPAFHSPQGPIQAQRKVYNLMFQTAHKDQYIPYLITNQTMDEKHSIWVHMRGNKSTVKAVKTS